MTFKGDVSIAPAHFSLPTEPIVVQHNCDLESGLCGWEYYSWNDMRQVGVVQPSNESAPRLGPPRDANPGTANGKPCCEQPNA